MRTVAVASSKGGVGKTSLTVNLGALFATQGVRVLLIDLDTQGHVATYLGAARGEAAYRLLAHEDTLHPEHIRAGGLVTRQVRPGLDLISGNPRTALAEHALRERMGAERVLTRRLRELDGEYDVCLLDLPPGFSLVSSVGLYAAQGVLVPVVPGSGPESGVRDLLARLDQMQREVERAPRLIGLVPNMTDPRERETRALLDFVDAYPHGPGIRRSVRMVESVRAGQTISEFEPASPAARDYAGLAEWSAVHIGDLQ